MGWADLDWGSLIGGLAGAVGSRSGNTQTTTQGVDPAFRPLAEAVAQRGMQFGNMPYTPYPFSRVADFNPYQFEGMDMTADRATQGGGIPQQAEQALGGVLGGNMMGPQFNPYSNAQTGVGRNPYAGANPYLEQNIQNTLGDITKSYNQTVAPTMAANAYQSGSFGNSGAQEMEDASRKQLMETLGRTSGNMRMQDYGMQQGLAESDISRRMGAQQQDLSRNAGLYESMFGRNQQGFDTSQARLLQGLGLSPSIYGLGYAPAERLMGIGSTMQQQGQNVMDANYGQFQEAQNWPFRTYDAMMAPFGRASGSTTTTQAPGGNRVAGLMGGAMLGSQIYNQWTGNPSTRIGQYGLPNYAIDPYGG